MNYSRSLPVLVGEVLLQARDKGLLPSDMTIAWEKFIARAWVECHSWDWSPEETAENAAALTRLAEAMDCVEVMQQSRTFRSISDWEASTEWLINWPHYPIDLAWMFALYRSVGWMKWLSSWKTFSSARARKPIPAKAIARVIDQRFGRFSEAPRRRPKQTASFCGNKKSRVAIRATRVCQPDHATPCRIGRRAQERDKAKAKSREYREQIDRMRKEKVK